jgi:transcriptional regulator with XRE-family HTH domain
VEIAMGAFSELLTAARKKDSYWEARLRHQFAADMLESLSACGISQREFAEKAGVSPGYVSRVLAGNENLSIRTLVKLARALDLEPGVHARPGGPVFERIGTSGSDWSALEVAAYRQHGAPRFQFVKPSSAVNAQPYQAEPARARESLAKVA